MNTHVVHSLLLATVAAHSQAADMTKLRLREFARHRHWAVQKLL